MDGDVGTAFLEGQLELLHEEALAAHLRQRPVEVIQALYRPDRYEYRVNLSRDNGDAPRWTVKIDK